MVHQIHQESEKKTCMYPGPMPKWFLLMKLWVEFKNVNLEKTLKWLQCSPQGEKTRGTKKSILRELELEFWSFERDDLKVRETHLEALISVWAKYN